MAGLIFVRLGLRALGVVLIGAYGAMGLDGLGHYTLALCAEHSVAANLTIWFEVVSGVTLMLASALLLLREQARARHGPSVSL